MEQNEIYEALGLDAPEVDPAESQAEMPTEGQEPPAGEGLGGQSVEAAPGGEQAAENVQTPDGAGAPTPAPKPTAQELEAERARLLRQEVDRAYAQAFAGQTNPYTGAAINSKADYEAYQSQLAQETQRQALERLRAAGVDPVDIQALLDNHPAIQQAQALVATVQAQQAETQNAQMREWYAGQIKEIAALDPEVTSLEALKAKDPEKYRAMLDMVGRGVSLSQAYKSLNFEALMQRQAAAAAQRERNAAAGKAHLLPTKGQGTAAVEVPDAVRERYLDMNPDMTEREMSEAYARFLKTLPKEG